MGEGPSAARQSWIDMSRALSVLGVALFHTTEWVYLANLGGSTESPMGRFWSTCDSALGHVRLPLLLLLSGMLAASKVHAGLRLPKTRVWILTNFYLFFVWEALYAVGNLLLRNAWVISPEHAPGRVFLELLIPVYTPLWYIEALAVYGLVLSLLHRLDPRLMIVALFAVGWLFDLIHVEGVEEPVWVRGIRLSIFFAMGVVAKGLLDRTTRSSVKVAAVVVAAGASVVISHFLPVFLRYPFGVLRSLAAGLAAMWLMRTLARHRRIPTGWLAYIGRRTLGVYVLHPPLIVAAAALVHVMPTGARAAFASPAGAVAPLLLTAAIVAVALLVEQGIRKGPGRFLFELPRRLEALVR